MPRPYFHFLSALLTRTSSTATHRGATMSLWSRETIRTPVHRASIQLADAQPIVPLTWKQFAGGASRRWPGAWSSISP